MILVSIQQSLLTFGRVRWRQLEKPGFRLDASLLLAGKRHRFFNLEGLVMG
jgi:hypothetical protein